MEELKIKVLSYCEIPEEISENHSLLNEGSCDVYVKFNVTSKEEQSKFDDDFELENWIIQQYPEVEGLDILIHMDY